MRRRFKQEVFFITEQDKQAKNGTHLTVSQYSTAQYHSSTAASMRFCCVHCGVCLLQVGESGGHQVVVGQLPTHTAVVCVSRP